MRQRHTEGYRQNARAILQAINAKVGQDFYTLSSSQVCDLLEHADLARYRKPKDASGSRGRYFYQLIQRRAVATAKP